MPLFKGKKKAGEHKKSIVLRVGSDRVSAALVIFSHGKRPLLVRHKEIKLKSIPRDDSALYQELLLAEIRGAITTTLQKLIHGSPLIPEHIHVSFESPWYAGQMRTVHYSKKEAFVFKAKLGQELLKTDFARFVADVEKTFGERLEKIDSRIIDIKLNGYTVAHAEGKKARECSITYFAGLAPTSLIASIKDTIEHTVSGKISFFSSAAAIGTALFMCLPEKKALVVHIGGEVTDILSIENGLLHSIASFPFGSTFLVQSLGVGLSENPLSVFSLLNLCRDGKAHDSIVKKVERIIEQVEEKWREELRVALGQIKHPHFEGTPVLLLSDDETRPWFRRMLEREEIFGGNILPETLSAGDMFLDYLETETRTAEISTLLLADCLYISGNAV